MRIISLRIQTFRNLEAIDLSLDPVVNVVHGPNAQGKTNLLEAIHLLATMKSFRGAKTAELVQWGAELALIDAKIERRGTERRIQVVVRPGSKVVHIDGKRATSLMDSFGHLHAVLFAPEDLAISKGSPSGRRTFLDRAIFNVLPIYFQELREFEKALRSRNSLLKNKRGAPAGPMLDVFDRQLAERGARIVHRRAQFVEAFAPGAMRAHADLAGGGAALSLEYQPNIEVAEGHSEAETIEEYANALVAGRGKDLARGTTSRGPQLDDLVLSLDDRPVRTHASQGQHRTIVLALKLAEIAFVERALDVRPILLLDDVSSELDRARNAQLLEFLDSRSGQVVITTTDPSTLSSGADSQHFRVDTGTVTAQENHP